MQIYYRNELVQFAYTIKKFINIYNLYIFIKKVKNENYIFNKYTNHILLIPNKYEVYYYSKYFII